MTLTEYPDLEQGSDEWLEARRGILTASVVGQLVTAKAPGPLDYACPQCNAAPDENCWSMAKKEPTPVKVPHSPRTSKAAENPDGLPEHIVPADNETSRNLTALLVSERITGWVDDSTFMSADIIRGHQVEPIARDWYVAQFDRPVTELGFMVRTFPSGARLGWSPDGLVDGVGGVEVKGPRAKKHLQTILAGGVPSEHMAQCQAGLLVSGREWLDFISYFGGMKPFVKRVHADGRWQSAILLALARFEESAAQMLADYDDATRGFASTDRLPDPYDIDLRF